MVAAGMKPRFAAGAFAIALLILIVIKKVP